MENQGDLHLGLWAAGICGFLAGIAWYCSRGSDSRRATWAAAAGIAGCVGFLAGFAEEMIKQDDAKRVTRTYEQCIPQVRPDRVVEVCKKIPYESYDPYRQPVPDALWKSFLTAWLEIPAGTAGIVLSIGVAKLAGGTGESPPLTLED
jgi:hypothetical protein